MTSIEQTKAQMKVIRTPGMLEAFERILDNPSLRPDVFEEGVSFLVEAEFQSRETRRFQKLFRGAKLKQSNACVEDIKYIPGRGGLNREVIKAIVMLEWIKRHFNIFLTGPTGTGKSWLACGFGNLAIRHGYPVLYQRLNRLLEDIDIARQDGSLPKLRSKLLKPKVLIIDDLAVAPLTVRGRLDLMELVEELHMQTSFIITSQLPVNKWFEWIGDETIADAIIDRLDSRAAYRLELQGESLRRSDIN